LPRPNGEHSRGLVEACAVAVSDGGLVPVAAAIAATMKHEAGVGQKSAIAPDRTFAVRESPASGSRPAQASNGFLKTTVSLRLAPTESR
jgi:hypothetical protein